MKCRIDFVSNSSSSSFVFISDSNDTLTQTMRKIAQVCSKSKEDCFKRLESENMKKLEFYVPQFTCIMRYGDNDPTGISNKTIEQFVKNGEFVKDKEVVWKWFKELFLDWDVQREEVKKDRDSYIAEYNKNSLALSKLYFEHNPIPTKEEYIAKLDSDDYVMWYSDEERKKLKENADKTLADMKAKRLRFEKILEGYKIIYTHINTSGDGVSSDKLFADPYVILTGTALDIIDHEEY